MTQRETELQKAASPAQTVRRMTEARAVLVRENPFFGRLALGLKLAVGTCGTACTDGSRLIFDPEFAARLSDRELQFVVLHEVLHCVLDHCTRGKALQSELYNVACDIVVNSMIFSMWCMRTFRVDGEVPMHRVPDGREGRQFSSEEVYEMLLNRQNTGSGSWEPDGSAGEGGEGPEGLKAGKKKGSTSKSGSRGKKNEAESGSPEKENEAKSGSRAKEKGGDFAAGEQSRAEEGNGSGQIDRHDIWRGIESPERVRDAWSRQIADAARACGAGVGMPKAIREIVEELQKRARVDWRQILHDFLQHNRYDFSFTPPDRRFADADFYLPAYNEDEDNGDANDLWVCVDTSGSISAEMLSEALLEIRDAIRQAGLTGKLSFFDIGITEPVPFENEEEFLEKVPIGGGGTSFAVIFEYLRTQMADEPPRAILVFTDGFAPVPDEAAAQDIPVLWLISEGGRTEIPWGTVTEMYRS